MPRPLVLCLVLVGCLSAACRDEAPAPSASPAPPVAQGTAGAKAPPPAMTLDDARELWDSTARGLLDSFRARAFDPARDGLLEHLEGTLAVRVGDLESSYRFTFDASHPPEEPVTFEVVSEAAGMAKQTATQARRWAIQSCAGAYPVVVFYRPPIALRLMPPTDRKSKDLIVWAPAFRGPLNVSYNFDERQVVTSRGEWTDENHKAVTRYEWEFWHGRYLMSRESLVDGSELEFEYDDRDGVNLLSHVHVRNGSGAAEATLTYRNVRRRPS